MARRVGRLARHGQASMEELLYYVTFHAGGVCQPVLAPPLSARMKDKAILKIELKCKNQMSN